MSPPVATNAVAGRSSALSLADSLAQRMLEYDPNYGGTHYALGLVAQHRAMQRLRGPSWTA